MAIGARKCGSVVKDFSNYLYFTSNTLVKAYKNGSASEGSIFVPKQ